MSEVILKEVGPNKVQVIKVLREVTGWGLAESKDAVDAVEQGTPLSINVPSSSEASAIDRLREVGAVVTSKLSRIGRTGQFADNDLSNGDSGASGRFQGESTTGKENVPMKEAGNTVSQNTASPQNREETLNTLYEVGKIAENYETLTTKATSIRRDIYSEKSKADSLRNVVSAKAKRIKWIVIACSLITWLFLTIFGIAITVILWIVMNKTVIKNDLKVHEAENNANAERYLSEHVAPLENELEAVESQIEQLKSSGKIEWAIDIVGENMFYSACIGDLYDLVKSRRADSLKEALNLYDDAQYKARMEERQAAIQNASEAAAVEAAKQTALSREIAKNTHQAATAAKATAYHTRQSAYHTRQIDKNTRRFR